MALNSIGRALQSAPDNPRYLFERGAILQSQKQGAAALADYEAAKRLAPQQAATYANIGTILSEEGRTAEAGAVLSEGVRLADSPDLLKLRLALLLPVICKTAEEICQARKRLSLRLAALQGSLLNIADPPSQIGAPAFFLCYQGENDRKLCELTARTLLETIPWLEFTAPHCLTRPRPKSGRLRLGIMSAHFREHTVGRVNEGIIRKLSRGRFELFMIRPAQTADEMTRGLDASADSVVLLPSDLKVARTKIAELELDLLLYPDVGMEGLSYFLAFARLAPVQCVGWGHPDTTGIPNLDYFLSSASFEPENAQEAYSEKLVRLGRIYNYLCAVSRSDEPLARADLGVPEGGTVYLCPQSPFKLHPDFDPVLRGVLDSDPSGRVLLSSGSEPHWVELLMARFEARIPEVAGRIQFIPRVEPNRFGALLRMADVIIDPIHFTGGYTSYLAFAQGCPVVSWSGRFLRGRMTAGLYRQMGVAGPVAATVEQYVEYAVEIGRSTDIKRELSGAIRSNVHLLFEDEDSVEELGEFLVSAYESSTRGELLDWRSQVPVERAR